jgi:hypothetical protein
MVDQTADEIVRKLMKAKDLMENTLEFAPKTLRKARQMNPVPKLKIVQLHNQIESLKRAKGDARKSEVSNMITSLGGSPVLLHCIKCGAELTPGGMFCGACGTKIVGSFKRHFYFM